jgi:NADH-quinone oxidoreductase subunit M
MTAPTLAAVLAAEAPPFALLPALIIMPAITALTLLVLPRRRPELLKGVALLGSSATAAVSIYLLAAFDTAEAGYQFTVQQVWVEDLGISLFLGVDGISLFLVVLTGIIFPIALLTSTPHHDPKPYYVWLLVLMAGTMGTFVALDLLLFFVFFEIVLVPMYFLIGGWGYGRRIYAAVKFFLYTMFGSALMLVGILALVFLTARNTGAPLTFNLVELGEAQALGANAARLVFVSFALAFAIKVPLFPVHTWLPDAHTEAPTAGSVILAAVMLKLGTYGLIRFGLYLFPGAAHDLAPVFLTLAVIGIVYGAVVATMQKDLKRLVAYSSVAHLGFIVLGTFAFNLQGLSGGILQMVNHGLSTAALFILVGYVYERRHTREISALSGLQKVAPVLAATFTLVMLSSIGLPGLNGFVGEFLILVGTFNAARWWGVVAVTGVVLSALYLLWAYQRSFHGDATGDNAEVRDLRWGEGLAILPLLVLIVGIGIYPRPMLERMEPSVQALIRHMEGAVPGFVEAQPEPVERLGVAALIEAAEESHGSGYGDDHGAEEGE